MTTHSDLVKAGEKYLYNNIHCGVVFTEFSPYGERPDILGLKSDYSVLIECKVSRSDFLADQKKPWRMNSNNDVKFGIGDYRFYLCLAGLIKKDELPVNWGLLYFNDNKIRRIVGPQGNVWGVDFKFDKNENAEYRLMYSALRRVKIRGHLDCIYEKMDDRPSLYTR